MTESTRVTPDPDRNLALELVRATEAAAINCSRLLGFGDKNAVDAAAVDAMRPVLGSVRMNGRCQCSTQPRVRSTALCQAATPVVRVSSSMVGLQRRPSCQLARKSSGVCHTPTASPAA